MKKMAITGMIAGFLIIQSIQARIINVPGDYASIQTGIDASNNGDSVVVSYGIWPERINFNGHQITLGSSYLLYGDTAAISLTIIDGQAGGPVVTFENDEHLAALIGFTIRNGRSLEGGGIKCDNASPGIFNNIITGNLLIGDGSQGGGICCRNNSHPAIAYNTIIGNRSGYGAGIATYHSSPYIYRNSIIGNLTTWSEIGGNGGGIYCTGNSSPAIVKNVIRADTAVWGGGGITCVDSAEATIIDNTISENVGGGIQLGVGQQYIVRNFIQNNLQSSMAGYGISCYNSSAEIKKNIITGNSGSLAGGIFCNGQYFAPVITNNVIYNNSGGIYLARSNQTIENTIIWGNHSYQIQTDSMSNPVISYCDIQGGWPGTGNIDTDPLFADTLGGDFWLQSLACGYPNNSHCIDAGDPEIPDVILNCSWGLGSVRSDMGAYGGSLPGELGIPENHGKIPVLVSISQNYPNPFNAQTTIQYNLVKDSPVNIAIYDILGQRIAILVNQKQLAGHHQVIWNAGDVSSGIYFYRISAGDYSETKKMVVMK